MPDFTRLDDFLRTGGYDGFLIDASSAEADQRYLSGFDAPDPFLTLYSPTETSLLVRGLEFNRAKTESKADTIYRPTDFGIPPDASVERHDEAVVSFVEAADATTLATPRRFPLATADILRDHGISVTPTRSDLLAEIRAVKSSAEIEYIRQAQRAIEVAMSAAEALLRATRIDKGMLRHDGEPLTVERVKEEIEITLLHHGCGLDDTIVAPGEQGADPHDRGSGPLPAHEPIVIDIFPQHKSTHYHADMTRTFVVGEPDAEVRQRYAVTMSALDAALSAIEPGTTGETVHEAACSVIESAGYSTQRTDPEASTGFIHSTGHGIGLDVHELPRLGFDGDVLAAGHVVTVEPGIYDPAVGGIRIEDLVLVTETGYENLTTYPKTLVIMPGG